MGASVDGGAGRRSPSSTRPPRASAPRPRSSRASCRAGSARTRASRGRSSPARSSDVRLGQRLTNPLAGTVSASAAESYYDQRVEEDWAGLTLSRSLSPSLGIGATWYGVYRGQRARNELSLQGVVPDGSSVAVSGVSDFNYSHYAMLLKLGVAWQTAGWNAGVSVTTPSLGVFGSGDAGYTVSLAGTDADGNGRPDPPYLVTEDLEDLDSDYHSPWAIGFGASRRRGQDAPVPERRVVRRRGRVHRPRAARRLAGRRHADPEARQRAERGRRLRARREPGRLGVRRVPHRLLGRGGERGVDRRDLGLGPLSLRAAAPRSG